MQKMRVVWDRDAQRTTCPARSFAVVDAPPLSEDALVALTVRTKLWCFSFCHLGVVPIGDCAAGDRPRDVRAWRDSPAIFR